MTDVVGTVYEGKQSPIGVHSHRSSHRWTPGIIVGASARLRVLVAHDAGAVHVVVNGPRLVKVMLFERVEAGMVRILKRKLKGFRSASKSDYRGKIKQS